MTTAPSLPASPHDTQPPRALAWPLLPGQAFCLPEDSSVCPASSPAPVPANFCSLDLSGGQDRPPSHLTL